MTKTKNKIFVILVTACILLAMVPFTVSAAEGYVAIIDMTQYSYSFNSSYPAPFGGSSRSHLSRISIAGNVAYCLEYGMSTYTGLGYNSSTSWDGLSTSKKQLINYALMFGYTGSTKYGGTVDQEYCATQVLIWQIAFDTVNTSWESSINDTIMGSGSVAVSVYNQIKSNVYNYRTIPSFTASSSSSAPEHELSYNSGTGMYEIEMTDSNKVLSSFSFQSSGYTITRNGNALNISTGSPKDSVTISATKSVPSSGSAGIIRYWTSSGHQTLASYDLGSSDSAIQAYFTLRAPIVQGVIEINKTGSAFTSVIESETDYGTMYRPVYENRPLSGVKFNVIADEDIYALDGTLNVAKDAVVDTITTDSDGKAKTKALYLGKYRVEEVSTVLGYVIDVNPHFVDLTTEAETVKLVTESLSLHNERQTVSVSFLKDMELGTAREDKPFDGVVFGLFARIDILSSKGSVIPADGLIELITPNKNGEAIITSDLPFGEYYVKELATSEGYIIYDTEYDFTFTSDNSYISVIEISLNDGESIYNEIMRGKVKLIKANNDGDKLLSGAVFELYTAGGVLVGEYTTDENGEIYVEGLSFGEYYWLEKTAPKGYVRSDKLLEFSITEDGVEIVITATNEKIVHPKTGDNAKLIIWLIVAGSAFASMACFGALYYFRKKKMIKEGVPNVQDN